MTKKKRDDVLYPYLKYQNIFFKCFKIWNCMDILNSISDKIGIKAEPFQGDYLLKCNYHFL